MNATAVNKQILRASNLHQLCQTSQKSANVDRFNIVNCVSWLRCFGRLMLEEGRNVSPNLLRNLNSVCQQTKITLEGCEPRHAASLMWTCAKLKDYDNETYEKALRSLCLQLVNSKDNDNEVSGFNSTEVSLMLWALGKLDVLGDNHEFPGRLAWQITSKRMKMSYLQIANTLHGLGNIDCGAWRKKYKNELINVIKYLLIELLNALPNVPGQELSISLNGLAKLDCSVLLPEGFQEQLASCLTKQSKLDAIRDRHVANIFWALAKLSIKCHISINKALYKISETLLLACTNLNSQELSMCLWGMSVIRSDSVECVPDDELLAFIKHGVEQNSRRLNAQQVSTIALALGKLNIGDASVRSLISLRTIDVAKDFNSQDLENMSSAMVQLNMLNDDLQDVLQMQAKRLITNQRLKVNSRNMINGFLSLAKLCLASSNRQRSGSLREAFSEMTNAIDLKVLNARDISNLAWTAASLKFNAEQFMTSLADIALPIIETFNPQECSKLLYALGRSKMSNNHEIYKATSLTREQVFDFSEQCSSIPKIHLAHIIAGGRDLGTKERESTGTTGATGGALWQDALVLARWLLRAGQRKKLSKSLVEFLGPACVKAIFNDNLKQTGFWKGLNAVELGAGVGLPSIIAACLGMNVVATDGDENVLNLLKENQARNKGAIESCGEGSMSVEKLEWGSQVNLQKIKLSRKPNIILASGVVYGRDPVVFERLSKTIRRLSGHRTLVLIVHGNGAAPGTHSFEGPFYESLRKRFRFHRVPPAELDEASEGCQLHVLIKDRSLKKRKREP